MGEGMKRTKRQFVALSAAAAALIGGGVIVAAAPSGAATSAPKATAATTPMTAAAMAAQPRVALAAAPAPTLPAHAVRLAAVAPASELQLDVTLTVRDQAALTAFLAGQSDRTSPYFHDFLTPAQFGQRFGASASQIATVETALRAEGLTPGAVSSNRLAIPVTATAAQVEHAFGIGLAQYRVPRSDSKAAAGTRVAYLNTAAPKLAAPAAPFVSGVLGLNDLALSSDMLSQPASAAPAGPAGARSRAAITAPDTAGPKACAAASNTANEFGGYTANELASYYLMSPLYAEGDRGKGVRVALAEIGPNLQSDINTYESCYGIKTPVRYIKVDGGAGTGSGAPEPEAALDIEDVAGLAPNVSIDVYQAPGSDEGVYKMFSAIVKADTDKVVSASFGGCEAIFKAEDPSYMTAVESVMEEADAQGQTVFASSGDSGSSSCYPFNSSATPDDNFPASSPNVVAVGGTTIEPSGGETVWNESADGAGAGGGGLSIEWCMPAYQYEKDITNLVNSHSKTNSACKSSNKGGYIREIPDVSADADPESGYVIYAAGAWSVSGGTSAAAPLWAAVAALIDASPFCADYGSGAAGVLPQGLYGMMGLDHSYVYENVPEGLVDITQGNNDYTPTGYTGGLYPATKGFDMATGLGVPLVAGEDGSGHTSSFYPGLAALMCQHYARKLLTSKVTGITPSAGLAGHMHTVTVRGAGFLPISGADKAIVGTLVLPATCTSSTACKVTLPALSARTINVRITAEDLTATAVTSKDRFRYVPAPHASALSPGKGTHKGGTTVTITGANFVNVGSVKFGGKAGSHLKVISATKLTVVTPAGSGTVTVTVNAAGGPSNTLTFRYT
jgi:subtilase family serine protease